MKQVKQNKMAVEPLKKLFWKMGLPMIISQGVDLLKNTITYEGINVL